MVLVVAQSYEWLKRFRGYGYAGLDTKKAPGASATVTAEMDAWLKRTVLALTPEDFWYDTTLWTCDVMAQLLSERYGVTVLGATINQHFHQLELTHQKPNYIPREQDAIAVEQFFNQEFQKFRHLLKKPRPTLALKTRLVSTCGSVQGEPGVHVASHQTSM